MEFIHKSVMLEECLNGLNLKDNGIYVDCTLGGGGHSYEILNRTNGSKLIGIDRDEDALSAASIRLKPFQNRITLVHSNFKRISDILLDLDIFEVDGIIVDLGVSSYQLDERERGFSYMSEDSKIDMRMDRSQDFSAYELINNYPEEKIEYILRVFGEEKFSKTIARNIVKKRAIKKIETTGELVRICEESIPTKFKITGGHPAKRTFQAIRIAVNEELDDLDKALKDMVRSLKTGGRLVVLTFHSLEDRIVKNVFRDLSQDCICDKRFPCVCGNRRKVIEINRKPICADDKEIQENSRSKSAKLRIIEKV